MIQPTAHLTKIGEWVLYDVYDPSFHFTVKGKVLIVPKYLYQASEDLKNLDRFERGEQLTKQRQFLTNRSLDFGCDMQLRVGDDVVFRYANHLECMRQGLYWHIDDNKVPALFVPYDTLFMAIRKKEQIMLNGWVWVEPVLWSKEEVLDEHGLIRAVHTEKKAGIGIIRNIGDVNHSYLYDKRGGDRDDVKIGDKVLFKKTAGVSVEWYSHQSLNEGRYPYYVMQRRDILAKVED